MCDDAFRWSMPNTPAGQPEMLCTTVNIGGRWWDEHFRLNLFQYSPISFSSASHFEIFCRFKSRWTFIGFHFSKKQILFSLLSNFWSRYHFGLFLLSFFLGSLADERATLLVEILSGEGWSHSVLPLKFWMHAGKGLWQDGAILETTKLVGRISKHHWSWKL